MERKTKPGLRVIQGTKETIARGNKEIGKKAIQRGYQWSNGQLGPKGEREMINAVKALMPGLGEAVINVAGPAILEALGMQAAEGEADNECVMFLGHLLRNRKLTAVSEAVVIPQDLDLAQIKLELSLLSKDWGLSIDVDGHYMDITGQPQMPTGMGYGGEDAEPSYDEVNVAVVYIETPKTELALNAKFIQLAPVRIAKLISLLEAKE
jgi:hypothetical protein